MNLKRLLFVSFLSFVYGFTDNFFAFKFNKISQNSNKYNDKYGISISNNKQLPPLKSISWNILHNLFKNTSNVNKSRYKTETKEELFDLIKNCQPNGVKASQELRETINSYVTKLEEINPTVKPAYSPLMNGFWRMLYTDFNPPAPSSGQLGPFIGDVYQDLDSTIGVIKNILKLDFPPIIGGLIAKQTIKNDFTWQIEFERVGNTLAGIISLPKKYFIPGDQIRLWEIIYLDEDLRILRARRPEADSKESF
eukprot:gene15979-21685_t